MAQVASNSTAPRYSEISEHLRQRICRGEFRQGDQLPSNIDLAKDYGTSPQTIRQSIGPLIMGGLLSSTRGRGTFVTHKEPTSSRDSITVVIPDTATDPVLMQIIRGITRSARADRRRVTLQTANYDLNVELEKIVALADGEYAGAVIFPVLTPPIIEAVSGLARSGFPLVLMCNWIPGLSVDFVGNDDIHNGRIVGEHLVDLGYEDIAFMGESMHVAPATYPRICGLREALQARQLDLRPGRVLIADHNLGYGPEADPFAVGYQSMLDLIKTGDLPRAIYASHDYLAAGALRACLDHRIDVPGRVAIIGSGDNLFTRSCSPQLSTVRFEHEKSGEKALSVLRDLIEGRKSTPKHHYGQGELVARGSTDPSLNVHSQ